MILQLENACFKTVSLRCKNQIKINIKLNL